MSEQPDHDPIRLMLLDDHGLFRASLARFLGSLPGFEVAAECRTSAEALVVLEGSAVDLILLDFDLGPETGNEFIAAARQGGYPGSFLIVAGTADPKSVAIALKHGASGIFLKSEAPERLVRAIQSIATGEVWIDPKVVQMLADRLTDPYLQFDEPQRSPQNRPYVVTSKPANGGTQNRSLFSAAVLRPARKFCWRNLG